ncbi:MAG TPA: c-type cytochrome [Caulobacteraceae bacterium]|jgi:cytochrome c2|nr:c-type cytochrome [Caulobacteraceae bacterium]
MFRLMVAVSLLLAAGLAGCGRDDVAAAPNDFGGDPEQGRILVTKYSCGSCHDIPGVAGAHGLVGPPLEHMGERTMVAGVLPNTPENLTRWIEQPQSVVPGNAMPDMGINNHDARDVAAYLYTLR